jgi:hypothetical protein
VVLDLDRLDRDAVMAVDPLQLLFARGNAALVRDVVVDGRTIVRDGEVVGVDLPAIEREFRGMYREGSGSSAACSGLGGRWRGTLGGWFEGQVGCGCKSMLWPLSKDCRPSALDEETLPASGLTRQ